MARKSKCFTALEVDVANVKVIAQNIDYLRKKNKVKNVENLWYHFHQVSQSWESVVVGLERNYISSSSFSIWNCFHDAGEELTQVLNKISPQEEEILKEQLNYLKAIRDSWKLQFKVIVKK